MKKSKFGLSPKRKTEDKYNFQSVFFSSCLENNATVLPIGKVLSVQYKSGLDVKTYPCTLTIPSQPYFYYYIQNENFEKDGVICQVIIKNQKLDSIIVNALHYSSYLFSTISDLRLINCNLGYKEILIISNMLQNQESLNDLTIDENPNNRQNFYCLFKNNNLKYISLQNCQINNRGMKLIASEIREYCKALILLDLTSNFICDEGVQYLANALRVNRSLTTLFLNDNWITDKGIESLMKNLIKFELRQDEIELRRKYNFDYELQKIKLTEKFLNGRNVDSKESIISHSTQKSILKKERTSSRKSKSAKGNNINSDLENYINNNLTKSNHPYQTECIPEDGKMYCIGNFKIAYLNISYNKITEIGLNYILQAIQYQNTTQNRTDVGLLQIILQGIDCEETPVLDAIKTIMYEKCINQMIRKKTAIKKY